MASSLADEKEKDKEPKISKAEERILAKLKKKDKKEQERKEREEQER